MKDSFYQRNFILLKKNHPQIAKLMEKMRPSGLFQIENSKSSNPTIFKSCQNERRFLHSIYDPKKEAERIIKAQKNILLPEFSSVLQIGEGLGYVAEAVLKAWDGELFLLFLDLDPLLLALRHRDLTFLLSSPRLHLLPPSALNDFQKIDIPSNAKYFVPPAFLPLLKEKSLKLFKFIQDQIRILQSQKKSDALLTKNALENKKLLQSRPDVWSLQKKFQGKPCMLFGGGPTGGDFLHQHSPEDLPDGIKYCCIGTSLAAVCAKGFKPDLVLITDPLPEVRTQIDILPSSPPPLAVLETTCPFIISDWPGEIYTASVDDEDQSKRLSRGGSVLTIVIDLLLKFGVSHLFLLGADFSFPGLRSHISDAPFPRLQIKKISRFSPFPSLQYHFLAVRKFKKTTSYEGKAVLTHPNQMTYKRWLERRAKKTQIPIFVIGNQGAKIEGISTR